MRFFYEPNFTCLEIQAFLDAQPGLLKGYHTVAGDREHTSAEILVSQTSLYSINPKIVLVKAHENAWTR